MNTDIGVKHLILPGVWLVSTLFFYPLLFPRLLFPLVYYSGFIFFSAGTLSLMALAWCCLDYKSVVGFCKDNFLPTMLMGIITGSCLLHYLLKPNYSVDYFFSSLIWVSVPCFVALKHRYFEKLLPYFLALLAIFNGAQSTKELFSNSLFCGIAGNWNWNGVLIVISTPFLMLFIIKLGGCLKWNFIAARALNILLGALTCYYLYLCDSKGVWVALVLATLLYFGVLFREKIPMRWILWISLIALMMAVIFLYSGGIAKLSAFFLRDVRIHLWTGTLQLIGDNFLFGVGQPLFESAFASYNPAEYYLNIFDTDRNPHPHNHLLFFLVSNGIFAFLAWLILLIGPIWNWGMRSIRTASLSMKLYFFIMLFLFFHSSLDVTLDAWPINVIFLVILGIFWGQHWKIPVNGKDDALVVSHTIRLSAMICFTFLIAALAVQLYCNALGSYYFREANIARDLRSAETALACYSKSIAVKPTPENIYQAALVAFYDLKNPQLCQFYLDQMEDLTGFKNYVNNNGLKAKSLYLQGRRRDSLKYFYFESRNFPLSSVNWYFYYNTLKEVGFEDEARMAYDKLEQSLAVKGLRFEHIPLLIKNPRWDMHFREVPGGCFKE